MTDRYKLVLENILEWHESGEDPHELILRMTEVKHVLGVDGYCQAEPECHKCDDTGRRRYGFGSMDLEPCGCKADLYAASEDVSARDRLDDKYIVPASASHGPR